MALLIHLNYQPASFLDVQGGCYRNMSRHPISSKSYSPLREGSYRTSQGLATHHKRPESCIRAAACADPDICRVTSMRMKVSNHGNSFALVPWIGTRDQ